MLSSSHHQLQCAETLLSSEYSIQHTSRLDRAASIRHLSESIQNASFILAQPLKDVWVFDPQCYVVLNPWTKHLLIPVRSYGCRLHRSQTRNTLLFKGRSEEVLTSEPPSNQVGPKCWLTFVPKWNMLHLHFACNCRRLSTWDTAGSVKCKMSPDNLSIPAHCLFQCCSKRKLNQLRRGFHDGNGGQSQVLSLVRCSSVMGRVIFRIKLSCGPFQEEHCLGNSINGISVRPMMQAHCL
jgi:hypothetical protein